ncbi:MAG: class I SAM-dependent methyltransferase [bacterium]|nr:class I SAM-dependent methyltransferase [bacterium]
MQTCYLCKSSEFKRLPGQVRDKAELKILECESCGLVCLDSFDHIQDGYYEDSGMHDGGDETTVQQWLRESAVDDRRRSEMLGAAATGRSLLDFGAGAGGFAEMIRDTAASVAVVEPESRLEERYAKLGVQRYADVSDLPEKPAFDLITMFHVMEHLPDPRAMLQALAAKLKPGGRIVIEVPAAHDALLRLYESEAFSKFTYWSCHLFLFTNETMRELLEQAGLKVNFIKQIQRYSVANHMHWLAKGRPGGHQQWSFLDSPELHAAYEKQLASLGLCDTIIAEATLVSS